RTASRSGAAAAAEGTGPCESVLMIGPRPYPGVAWPPQPRLGRPLRTPPPVPHPAGVQARRHLVHPYAPPPGRRGQRRERGRGVVALVDRPRGTVLVGQQGAQETLATDPEQQRAPEVGDRLETAEELPVVRGGLGEPDRSEERRVGKGWRARWAQ